MMETSDEIFRAFRAVAPEILGRKKTRKLLEGMLAYLSAQIPPNGVGPVISLRRDACRLIAEKMLVLEQDRESA